MQQTSHMATVKAAIGRDHYLTHISSPTRSIQADEPVADGGNDEGLSPSELLCSSLAACTCITVRMYADRKEFPLEGVEVTVSIGAEQEAEHTQVDLQISFAGPLTDEQRNRLLVIAGKCPIHKVLSNPITIKTNLV